MFGFGAAWWPWAALAATLAAVLTFWPWKVTVLVQADVLGRGGRILAKGALGRLSVRSVHGEEGLRASVELVVFHLLRIRRTAAGGTPSVRRRPGGGKPDVRVEGADLTALLDELWNRWRPGLAALLRAGLWLLPRLRVRGVRVQAEAGLADAARTAIVCGGLWSLFGVAAGLLQRRGAVVEGLRIELRPVYNRWVLKGQVEAVVIFRLWDLAGALFRAIRDPRRKVQGEAGLPAVRPQNV